MDKEFGNFHEDLAYRTYGEWASFWSKQATFANYIPGLYHDLANEDGEAIMIAPCGLSEYQLFAESQKHDTSVIYTHESSDLTGGYIGFWTRFRVGFRK